MNREEIRRVRVLKKEYENLRSNLEFLGENKPEFKARRPKVEAYNLLINLGISPEETVQIFNRL